MESIKRVVRGLRLICAPVPPSAPQIPQAQLDGCRFLSSRDVMLSYLPHGGRVAEVGVLYGQFSARILEVCTPVRLDLIDRSFAPLRADVRGHKAVVLNEGDSAALLAAYADESFDWIYIDGDHRYEGVCRDIEAAKAKVKRGGYLVFNDFGRIIQTGLGTFGVHQAVCEFAVRDGWPFAYFCFNKEALYDVALRRPGV